MFNSIADVNKKAPLLKSIGKDMNKIWIELVKIQKLIDYCTDTDKKKIELKILYNENLLKLREYIKEVEQLNGTVETIKEGCFNFESVRNGRKVILSFIAIAEDKCNYWYEVDESLADRKPW